MTTAIDDSPGPDGEAVETLQLIDRALGKIREQPGEAQSLLETVLEREPENILALERLAALDPDGTLERLTAADRQGELSSWTSYELWVRLLASLPATALRARRVALRASERFAGEIDKQLIVAGWLARLDDTDQAWRVLQSAPPSLSDEQVRLLIVVVRTILAAAEPGWEHRRHATGLVVKRLNDPGHSREDRIRIDVAALLSDEGHFNEAGAILSGLPPDLQSSRPALAVRIQIDASLHDWAAVHRATDRIRAAGDQLLWSEEIYRTLADAESGRLRPALEAVDRMLKPSKQDPSEPAAVRVAIDSLCHLIRYNAAYNSGDFEAAWRSVIAIRRILRDESEDAMRPAQRRELEVFALAGLREPVGELPPAAGWASAEDHDYEVARLGALVLWGANDPGRARIAEDEVRCALIDIQQQPVRQGREVARALDLAYICLLAEQDTQAWNQLKQADATLLREARGWSDSPDQEADTDAARHVRDLQELYLRTLRAHAALRTHRAERALEDVEYLIDRRPHELEYRILRVHALFSCDRLPDAAAAAEELCILFPDYAPGQLWRAEILTHVSPESGAVPLESLIEGIRIYARVIESDVRLRRFLAAEGEADGSGISSDPLSHRLIAHASRKGVHAAIQAERVGVGQRLPRDRGVERQATMLVDALAHVDGGAHGPEARRLKRLLHRPRQRARLMRLYKAAVPIVLVGLIGLAVGLIFTESWDDTVGRVPTDVRLWIAVLVAVLLAWPYVKGMTFAGFSFEKVDPDVDLRESDAHVLAGIASGASVLRARAMKPPSTVSALSERHQSTRGTRPDPVSVGTRPTSEEDAGDGEEALSPRRRSDPSQSTVLEAPLPRQP